VIRAQIVKVEDWESAAAKFESLVELKPAEEDKVEEDKVEEDKVEEDKVEEVEIKEKSTETNKD
jgi:hypothetical protein